jgi:hypothetical protein
MIRYCKVCGAETFTDCCPACRASGVPDRSYEARFDSLFTLPVIQSPAVRKVCAWCGKLLEDAPAGAPVSHGICPDCFAKQLADIHSLK